MQTFPGWSMLMYDLVFEKLEAENKALMEAQAKNEALKKASTE